MFFEILDDKKEMLIIFYQDDININSLQIIESNLLTISEFLSDNYKIIIQMDNINNISFNFLYLILKFLNKIKEKKSSNLVRVNSEMFNKLLKIGQIDAIDNVEEFNEY